MSEVFKLKTEKFEGPLGLLLDLIEQKKLHISEISLARVADDYLIFLSAQNKISKNDLANFLIIASTLLFIKSTALLPTLERTEEESASIEELERRLILYQKFRKLSGQIKRLYDQERIFYREESKNIKPIFTPTKEINLGNLRQAIKQVISELPKFEKISEVVVKKVISLESVIKDLTQRIQVSLKLKFSEFVGDHKKEKINIIVGFLGILELVRQGIISANQNQPFEDINMETKSPGLPRYF